MLSTPKTRILILERDDFYYNLLKTNLEFSSEIHRAVTLDELEQKCRQNQYLFDFIIIGEIKLSREEKFELFKETPNTYVSLAHRLRLFFCQKSKIPAIFIWPPSAPKLSYQEREDFENSCRSSNLPLLFKSDNSIRLIKDWVVGPNSATINSLLTPTYTNAPRTSFIHP